MASQVSLEYLNQALLDQVNITAKSLSAMNLSGSTISVILGGTPVYLPIKPYMIGFDVNGANTIFTVKSSGNYLVSYNINTTTSLLMSSSLYVNNNPNPQLTRNPNVGSTSFNAQAIVPLSTGDQLQLTLFGLIGTAILQSGQGAVLNIIKIS